MSEKNPGNIETPDSSTANTGKRTEGTTNGTAHKNGAARVAASSEKTGPDKQFAAKGEQSVQNTTPPGDLPKNEFQKADRVSSARLEPLAVTVETNLDKAMKILKRKLIKEGLFKELKTRRYFEKPSEKKKRKMKETMKKLRKEEARARKNSLI